jgi:hypothetical protein
MYIGIVASDASATDSTPFEGERVCLGRSPDRATVRGAPESMAHAVAESPTTTSTYL